MVSQVCTYPQTHCVVHIIYVQHFMSSYLNTVVLKKEREKAKKKTLTFTLLTLPHSLSEPFSWREQAVMMSSLLERPTRQGTEGGLWPTACEEQSPPPPPHATTWKKPNSANKHGSKLGRGFALGELLDETTPQVPPWRNPHEALQQKDPARLHPDAWWNWEIDNAH